MKHARIPILTLVCALCLIAAPTGGHLAAQSAPDTCWVEGYLFGNDMSPARLRTVEIRKVVKTGYLFVFGTAKPQTDTSGYIRFPVPRGSTAYIYADLPGLRTTQPDGVALVIPNTPTARIETLVPASPVPPSYVVAIPPQRYRVLEDGTLKADTIHTLDVSGAIVTSPSPGTAHLQITGGSVVAYGDSIHVADSIARANADSVQRALARRVFVSRLSAAITLDSSTDGAGRIYYTVSLHPDSVQAFLRDSSMTWMLGRVVQLADSGIAERGYMTPTQIRTLLAGYSISGHAHAIADVTGLATALGDTVSYRDRMTSVEGSLAVILDTINAVRGRLAALVTDLNTHIGTGDAHLPSQTGANGKFLQSNGTSSSWQTALTAETDPTVASKIADSLANLANALTWKLLPAAIRPTGALGQSLKILPGGVVGWAPDSASGAGAVPDSLKIRTVWYDSTSVIIDSVAYISRSIRAKVSFPPINGGDENLNAYAYGWVDYECLSPFAYGVTQVRYFKFVSDSANSVQMLSYDYETHAFKLARAEYSSRVLGYGSQFGFAYSTGSTTHGGTVAFPINQAPEYHRGPLTVWNQLSLKATNSSYNAATFFAFTIRIHYRILKTSASTWYVKPVTAYYP